MNIFYDSKEERFFAPCAICGRPVFENGGWALIDETRPDYETGGVPVVIVHQGLWPDSGCLVDYEKLHGKSPDHHLNAFLSKILLDLCDAKGDLVVHRCGGPLQRMLKSSIHDDRSFSNSRASRAR